MARAGRSAGLRRLLLGLAFAASPFGAARGADPAPDAEASYQAGVQQYSQGHFMRAGGLFRECLRLEPGHRAARLALERLRVEHANRPLPLPAASAAAPRRPAKEEEDAFAVVRRAVFFEDTLGDARNDLGRQEALLGRVAQLRAERDVSRARGRAFARDAELHALSRRLSAGAI